MTDIAKRHGTEVACPSCGSEILMDIAVVEPLLHEAGKCVVDVVISRLWCDECGREFDR